jgi:hypothetical protein
MYDEMPSTKVMYESTSIHSLKMDDIPFIAIHEI